MKQLQENELSQVSGGSPLIVAREIGKWVAGGLAWEAVTSAVSSIPKRTGSGGQMNHQRRVQIK